MLLFNIILVFFPIGSLLTLDTYEKQLLDSLERNMVQQGRVLSSALMGHEDVLDQRADEILENLAARTESRIRVVDSQGFLLADSVVQQIWTPPVPLAKTIVSRSVEYVDEAVKENTGRDSLLYRIAVYPMNIIRNLLVPPEPPQTSTDIYGESGLLEGPEISSALEGRYGAATRITTGERSVTLYSAIPILAENGVSGVVLVSQSSYKILADLYELRLDVTRIFFLAILAAVVISLILSWTITIPVHRLRVLSDSILDHRGKLLGTIPPGRGGDEIALLRTSLHRFSVKLEQRQNYIDSFLADTVHEINNPVTGVITSLELARDTLETESSGDIRFDKASFFLSSAEEEIHRVQNFVASLREINYLENRLDEEVVEEVELTEFLYSFTHVHGPGLLERKGIILDLKLSNDPTFLIINPERLNQALVNIIDNAESFSPDGGTISLSLVKSKESLSIIIGDQGQGIPTGSEDMILRRFFSDRPDGTSKGHSGLGLSIVKAIVEGAGGKISVGSSSLGGAEFRLEWN